MTTKSFFQRIIIYLWYLQSKIFSKSYEKDEEYKRKIIQLLNDKWTVFDLPEYLVRKFFRENRIDLKNLGIEIKNLIKRRRHEKN